VQRVRERVPIADRNRVAVSLDHLPAGPPALAFELEEIGARLAHEVGGPGVPQHVGAEDRDVRSGADPLEHFLPALDGERVPGVGGEERPVVTEIAARAEVAVELAPDGRWNWTVRPRPNFEVSGRTASVQAARSRSLMRAPRCKPQDVTVPG
jgi:hypothetical protein